MSALRRLALPCCLLLSVGCVAAKQESAAREQDAPPAAERAEDKAEDPAAGGGSPGAKPSTPEPEPLAEAEEAQRDDSLADDADGNHTRRAKTKAKPATSSADSFDFAGKRERDAGDLLSEVRLVGDPVVGGGLDRDIVRRRTKVQVKDVAVCHDLELRRSPGLSGKIVVRLTLDADGAVEDAELVDEDSDIGSPATERCVLEAVKRWTFPAPEDGSATVEISLELAPK